MYLSHQDCHTMLFWFIFLGLVGTQRTDITQEPGWANQRSCAQCILDSTCGNGIGEALGCNGWFCVCAHYDFAITYIASAVLSGCKSQIDVDIATSMVSDLCGQINGVSTSQSTKLITTVLQPTTTTVVQTTISSTSRTLTSVISTTVIPSCICRVAYNTDRFSCWGNYL